MVVGEKMIQGDQDEPGKKIFDSKLCAEIIAIEQVKSGWITHMYPIGHDGTGKGQWEVHWWCF